MKRKPHRLLTKITLALAITLVCLVFIEIFLQLTYGQRKPAYAVSPGGGKIYEIFNEDFVHEVRTNKMNLRDEEFAPKQDDEYRVLFTGDSFTFALGVDIEDSFIVQMEKRLLHEGKWFNALNYGGSWDFVFNASSTLREMKPDALIAQVFIGNDFYDLQSYMHREFEPIGVDPTPKKSTAIAPMANSQTGNISVSASEQRPVKPKMRLKLYTLEILWRSIIKVEFFDDLLFKMNLRYGGRPLLLKEHPELEKRLVTRELELLSHLQKAAEAQGIDFYIFLIPFKVQCLKSDLLDKDKYDYQKPNRILRDFSAKNNIPCLDFLELYDKMDPRTIRTFYYNKDMHWTKAGHRYAAEALSKFLVEQDPKFSIKQKSQE